MLHSQTSSKPHKKAGTILFIVFVCVLILFHRNTTQGHRRFSWRGLRAFVTPSPSTGGTSCNIPQVTRYEAESGILNGPAKTSSCSRASGGSTVAKMGMINGVEGTITFSSIKVRLPGKYLMRIDYLSTSTRSLVLTINGVALPSIDFPATGSWCGNGGSPGSKYVDVTLKWTNTIKLGNPSGVGPVIDFIEIPNTAIKQTPHTYEAETGQLAGGASIASCSSCSCCGSYVALGNGGSTELTVNAGVPGIHLATFAYWAQSDITLTVTVNSNPSTTQTVVFPSTTTTCSTGGARNTYNINVQLQSGSNSIKIQSSSTTNADIDFIVITRDNPKKGLIYGNAVNSAIADNFADYLSWFYRYTPAATEESKQWAAQHDLEFAPMISNTWFDGKRQCHFRKVLDGTPQGNCTAQNLMQVVASNDLSRTFYLQGFNEPWNPNQAAYYGVSNCVKIWKEYIAPAAAYSGLKLVSPNFKYADKGINWIADFLGTCCADSGCDVDGIAVLAVHEYQCKDSYWRNRYDLSQPNNMWEKLITRLTIVSSCRSASQWREYVMSKDVWVTEFNCEWDPDKPSNAESCKRQSHQTGVDAYKYGSIQWMDKSPKITRYAWWTTRVNKPEKNQLLVDYNSAKLNPTGQSYRNPYSVANCVV